MARSGLGSTGELSPRRTRGRGEGRGGPGEDRGKTGGVPEWTEEYW